LQLCCNTGSATVTILSLTFIVRQSPSDEKALLEDGSMHIAEGVLPLSHAASWSLVSAPFVIESARRCKQVVQNGDPDQRAMLTLSFAFVFAATIFPVPVPVAGVSSHMCFTALMAFVLGPWLTVLPVALVLLIQALFFAHGGLSTLGANVFSLGVLAPFAGYGLGRIFFRLRSGFVALGVAAALSDLLVYIADAGMLALAFDGSGSGQSFSEWFRIILTGFAPAQVPLAALEGVLTALLLRTVAVRRRELLPDWMVSGIKVPTPRFAPAAIASLLLVFSIGSLAHASDFTGIDELVIESAATQAGRAPRSPLIDLDRGDLGLFVFCLGGFVSGVFVGLNWSRLFGNGHDKPRTKAQAIHAP
jgi:cobalt/nickel transport system permease protein